MQKIDENHCGVNDELKAEVIRYFLKTGFMKNKMCLSV